MTHKIHIFISHSWSYSGHYKTLADWILYEPWNVDGTPIEFYDFSIPEDNPIHNVERTADLKEAIDHRIMASHVAVIPAGMYAGYSRWIKHEISGAKDYGVPILAVDPWGQQRSSSVVISSADDSCGWNKKTVAQKIWNLYSGRFL